MNRRQLLVLALMVLLALGGALLAAACGGGEDNSATGQTEPSVTVTITPESTAPPTPTALPPTQPPPTPSPSSTAVPTLPPAPTADTRVPFGEIPTADQIQLGKDGKYFIADRGDGCTWVERVRQTVPEIGDLVILHTDCLAVDFAYVFSPATGEVSVLIP